MIALGCDHAGFLLMEHIRAYLDEQGLAYKDYGTFSTEMCEYPEFGEKVGRAVASGECERGIVVCGSGIGISVAASKVKGTRVCACSDCYSAKLSRQHNNSNVLAMGAKVVGAGLALMIAETWLNTDYDPELDGGRHEKRIQRLNDMIKE